MTVTATVPPTARTDLVGRDVYPPGAVRASASMSVMDDGYDG